LKKAGLIEKIGKDFKITNNGKKFIKDNPSKINKQTLCKIPEFSKYLSSL